LLGLSAIAIVTISASNAFAETPMVEKTDDDVQHNYSITVSPFHLVLPVIELTGEYRVADKIGVAGMLGAGQVTVKELGTDEELSFTVFEVGAGARYYLIGSFIHGMQLGTELQYIHVSTDDAYDDVSGFASGGSVGAFAGYKIATNVGFTFEFQLGAQYIFVGAEAESDSTGEKVSDSDTAAGPLLNLQFGYSF
jgi:hypothetical protein